MENLNYDFYYNSYLKHGISAKGVHWHSKKNQYKRFEVLSSYIKDIKNPSILDLGCGFGEYLNYLKQNNLNFKSYLGVDCEEFMIEIAKKRFPNNNFIKANVLEDKIEAADYVICSGTFSIMDKETFTLAIQKSFELAKKALVFNFLTSNTLHNLSEDEIIEFSKKLTNNIQTSTNYIKNDSTIKLTK